MDPRVKRLTLQLRARYAAFLTKENRPHTIQHDDIVGLETHFHFVDPSWRKMPWGFRRGKAYTGSASFATTEIPLSEAYRAASAIVRGEDLGLRFELEDEYDPWDGESPAPKYLFYACIPDPSDSRFPLASLGMVGVDSLDDPYLDILKGELFEEAIAQIETENERKATIEASELAERATYAAG